MKIIIHGRSEIKFYIYGHFRAQKVVNGNGMIQYKLDRYFFIVFVLFWERTQIKKCKIKLYALKNEPI